MILRSDTLFSFKMLVQRARIYLSSVYAYTIILSLAAIITATKAEVFGAIIFAYVIAVYLIFFDDLISSMLPFLLLCTFTLKCYDSFDAFVSYILLAIPPVAAVVFHFVYYKKSLSIGENFTGICAVAVAVTLGGLFSISAEDYFSPTSIYHVFALGIGMVIGYLLIRASLDGRPICEASERFTSFMYLWGAFAAYMIYQFILSNLGVIIENGEIPYIQWSNNIATMLMLTMPFPFYYALKRPIHLIPGYLIYVATLLSSSRGGILFGTAEIVIITVYVIFAADNPITRHLSAGILVTTSAVVCKNILGLADILNISLITTSEELIGSDEARVTLLKRSIEDFKSNVIFGRGLGYRGNTDTYDPKKGALYFYHMMIPQVIGSMGLCGAFGYLCQFILRVRTVLRRISPLTLCLFISYLGLFMMSQVNPGEFVPIPYSLVAVTTFIIIENQPIVKNK